MRNLGLLAFLTVVSAASAVIGETPPPVVICPAVSFDDHSERYSTRGSIKPVAMMVVGSLDRETMKLAIERVLFGPQMSEVTLVEVRPEAMRGDDGPRIYCLSLTDESRILDPENPGRFKYIENSAFRFTLSQGFEHHRIFSLKEEPTQIVMAQARLDRLVLGSVLILVGRPANEKTLGTIKVERVLQGDQSTVGKTVHFTGTFDPYPTVSGSYIYFIEETRPWNEPVGQRVQHRWPDSEIPIVEATLKRRALFPVHDGKQEICLTGSVGDAIAFLGTDYEPGQKLAERSLILKREAALPVVAAFVENHLFTETGADLASYDQQMRLIDVLGSMEDHRSDGEVVRLIHSMLDQIQAGATFPHTPALDKADRWSRRYLTTDANHSLLWLLLSLDPPDAARLFGPRLLKLRALAAYGWQAEIQHALDHGHFEDHLELAALRQRMATIKPLTWSAVTDANNSPTSDQTKPISKIEFVDGGARLRTVSHDGVVCHWDAKTGKAIALATPQPKDTTQTAPATSQPNDKVPTVTERTVCIPYERRVQRPRSGRKLQYGEYEYLSEDRTQWYSFQTTDFGGAYGPLLAFSLSVSEVSQPTEPNVGTETAAAAIGPARKLGDIDLNWGQESPFGLVPDGVHLHFATQIYRRDNLQSVSAANVLGKIYYFVFLPDGSRYLLLAIEQQKRLGPWPSVETRNVSVAQTRVHDTKTGRTLLAVEFPDSYFYPSSLSLDGRFLAIVTSDNTIQVWPVPGE